MSSQVSLDVQASRRDPKLQLGRAINTTETLALYIETGAERITAEVTEIRRRLVSFHVQSISNGL